MRWSRRNLPPLGNSLGQFRISPQREDDLLLHRDLPYAPEACWCTEVFSARVSLEPVVVAVGATLGCFACRMAAYQGVGRGSGAPPVDIVHMLD